MTKEVKPWERQEKETPKQFEAFVLYRNMGEDRSLSAVAKKLGKRRQLLGRWSAANKWVERCVAWDNEQDRLLQIEQFKDIKKMRKKHADVASAMIALASKGIANMLDENKKLKEDLNPHEIAKLVEVGAKLERLSRGDVGDVIEQRDGGEAMNAVQIYIPDNNRGRDKETFDDLEV